MRIRTRLLTAALVATAAVGAVAATYATPASAAEKPTQEQIDAAKETLANNLTKESANDARGIDVGGHGVLCRAVATSHSTRRDLDLGAPTSRCATSRE